MTTEMDATRAARLLERWFSFYGMDDPETWPPEDYPQIERAYEAMQPAATGSWRSKYCAAMYRKRQREFERRLRNWKNGRRSTAWKTRRTGNRWTFRLCAMCWKPCALPPPF